VNSTFVVRRRLPASDLLDRLLAASIADVPDEPELFGWPSFQARKALSVRSANRQGVTIRVHAGAGPQIDNLVNAFRNALLHLEHANKSVWP